MRNDIRKLADKYFRGECTTDEARQVLAWFDTAEGQSFLSKQLDQELDQLDEFPGLEIYSRVPTSRIRARLDQARRQATGRTRRLNIGTKHSRYSGAFATAATFLLLVAVSFVLYFYSPGSGDSVQPEQQEIVYSVGAEEHKILSLSDGSVVRLNSNSQLTMPEVFREDRREVRLNGEAYFEINPNPEKPFIVSTDHAVIKVLGTAFNVKTYPGTQHVLVAVQEGKVSFRQKKDSDPQEVLLTKNQLGYMDAEMDGIKVERVVVDNYLSWLTRRMVFDNTPFLQVCAQLERIYEVECSLEDEQLAGIYFTADFERQSLEKTLEVIAHSLDISYQAEEGRVVWIQKGNKW